MVRKLFTEDAVTYLLWVAGVRVEGADPSRDELAVGADVVAGYVVINVGHIVHLIAGVYFPMKSPISLC